MIDNSKHRIHVVAGILSDSVGRVLVAQRPSGKHLAGAWEFPGGKIEPGETPYAALRRELREELDIEIGSIEPVIGVPWHYAQKSIFLDVYRVLDYSGTPHGREAQALDWRLVDELVGLNMPPPDRPVVTALRLPSYYAITPEPSSDDNAFIAQIERVLANGIQFVQLRAKTMSSSRLSALARAAHERMRAANGRLLLNGNIDIARELDVDGVHLPAVELMRLKERPLGCDRWLAASCHNAIEIAHAIEIGIDFAVLGPVKATQSHPGSTALGWPGFAQLCSTAPFPIYALGGLNRDDLDAAKAAGAQGIAGISAF